MLNPELPGNPAFSQLRPAEPRAQAVSSKAANTLCGALGMPGRISRLTGSENLVGCYFLDRDMGAPLFVKVIPIERAQHLRQVDALTNGLGEVAAGAIRLAEATLADHVVLAYPFVDGRRAGIDESDMRLVGNTIATLHQALKREAKAKDVRERALEWLDYLEQIAHRASSQGIDGFPAQAAEQLRCRLQPLTKFVKDADAQVLHGDLNFGNILIRHDGKAAFVVDFENVIRSFGGVHLDIVFALERFCFPASAEADTKKSLARALLKGYGEKNMAPKFSPEDVSIALEVHSMRALAVLAAMAAEGRPLPLGEIDKFLTLLSDIPGKVEILAGL